MNHKELRMKGHSYIEEHCKQEVSLLRKLLDIRDQMNTLGLEVIGHKPDVYVDSILNSIHKQIPYCSQEMIAHEIMLELLGLPIRLEVKV